MVVSGFSLRDTIEQAIVYQGQFEAFESIVPKNVRYQLNKSLIFKQIVRW
jgi:hypothetical protein